MFCDHIGNDFESHGKLLVIAQQTPFDMSADKSPGRPPDKTDEEIVATVRALIEDTDSPAVERKIIQDNLEYSEPAMRKRLNSLVKEGKIGRYDASGVHIFWVSENSDTGGEADAPEVFTDIESIDPDDVSTKKAREIALEKLPDYQPKTKYHTIHNFGDTLLRAGIVIFSIGIMLLLTQTTLSELIPPLVQARIVLVGFGFVASGGILQVASFTGQKLSERGIGLLS